MKTPFWFGEALSTDEANYDGNNPYHEGKKGEYRERTVPVKSFRRNPWGLYQMHGNVWEWCEDVWHPSHQGADPQGRPRLGGESEEHVCRGGSWFSIGRLLRAASRIHWHVGYGSFGLRLARGPESTSKPEG
jgi:formylglycine-generating enzyme required for sulfatase activity